MLRANHRLSWLMDNPLHSQPPHKPTFCTRRMFARPLWPLVSEETLRAKKLLKTLSLGCEYSHHPWRWNHNIVAQCLLVVRTNPLLFNHLDCFLLAPHSSEGVKRAPKCKLGPINSVKNVSLEFNTNKMPPEAERVKNFPPAVISNHVFKGRGLGVEGWATADWVC